MLAGAWPEGPEALFVNMMQRYVVPVRRRDWTLSTGDAMEETSEWELTAGCSRRRPRSGDFLCALWVVGIPASSKGRRSSVELWTRPAPASPLAQHSGVDKAASLPDCSPAQCDAGVRVVAASPGQKLVSAHCPGSPPLPGAGPEDLGRELKILPV